MTTAAERQSRRRTKLNQIATAAGYASWAKYETLMIKKGQIEMNEKTEYTVWAGNRSGASMDVANHNSFTSINDAAKAARNELGSGWTVHIIEKTTGYEVKSFTIR